MSASSVLWRSLSLSEPLGGKRRVSRVRAGAPASDARRRGYEAGHRGVGPWRRAIAGEASNARSTDVRAVGRNARFGPAPRSGLRAGCLPLRRTAVCSRPGRYRDERAFPRPAQRTARDRRRPPALRRSRAPLQAEARAPTPPSHTEESKRTAQPASRKARAAQPHSWPRRHETRPRRWRLNPGASASRPACGRPARPLAPTAPLGSTGIPPASFR